MGRTKAFDPAEVARAARAVFWTRGFESASLPELQEATGLSASSIYHSFGSKRGLFDAAVASYLDEVARPRWQPLTAPQVQPDALVDYLIGLRTALRSSGTLPADHGCLLLNTASAPLAGDDTVARAGGAYCAERRSAIGRGVDARRPDLDPAARSCLADACTGQVVAAFTLVRVDAAQAARCLDAALTLVHRPGSGERSS
jgi:AcrR family transcriptional regulator